MSFIEHQTIRFFNAFHVAQFIQFLAIIFTVSLLGGLEMFRLPIWYVIMPMVFCLVTYIGVMTCNMIFKDYMQNLRYLSIKHKLTKEVEFIKYKNTTTILCKWMRYWMVYGLTGSLAINANIFLVLCVSYMEYGYAYVPEYWLDTLYHLGIVYSITVGILTAFFGIVKNYAVKRILKTLHKHY